MKRQPAALALCLGLAAVALGGSALRSQPRSEEAGPEAFSFRVLATGLEFPFEITWGPDGYLWVTERGTKRVTRVRPSDGVKSTVLTIPEVLYTDGTQDGLLGMALDPGLLKG